MSESSDLERRIHLGRRIEAMPTALFSLLLLTLAVVIVALFVGFRNHTASDGTDCGGALVPVLDESVEYQKARCEDLLADTRPIAFALLVLAVMVVLISAMTLIVRGWGRREPPPWPGA